MVEDERDRPLAPGTVLDGKYRIIGPIGEGGMGIVYHARHLLMRKDVAIKRLHPSLSAVGQIVQRFEREAQAAARIEHPNVCLVTDCGHDEEGGLYIVMELLQGLSLQEVLEARGTLDFPTIFKLSLQICSALEQAHSLGIVHRDLKPDNIMLVEREGDPEFVKIMDFGIAKMVTDDTPGMSLTQAGMVFGTPHYLSPEQASGDIVDHRSDLYSLGVILFEMGTGKRPFDATSAAALIRKHVTNEPPTLVETAPGRAFPQGFQELISRLLAKDPEDRHPSAKVVSDHLKGLRELFDAGFAGITSPTSLAQTAPMPPPLPTVDDLSVEVQIEPSSPSSAPGIEISAEQKIAHLWSMGGWKRWALLGGALLIPAAAAGIILAVVLHSQQVSEESGQDTSEASIALLEQERSEFSEQPEIKQALTLTVEGRSKEAIESLESLSGRPEYASAHLYYHLAVLHSNSGNLGEATDALGKCLEIQPDYRTEPILLGILVQALHDETTRKQAAEVMIAFPSETLAHRIESLAREEPDRRLRGRTISILRAANMMRYLEPWSRHAAELADPDPQLPCESRRKSLEKLLELHDPRTLPALALFKDKNGCEGSDCWACLRDEWQKVVDSLEPPSGSP